MKFVVLKGITGFGDRLQCLLQAIRYAEATGRYLVIDWRDHNWTHQPGVPLHYYFTLEGVRTFGWEEFAAFYDYYQRDLTITPPDWRPKILRSDYPTWMWEPIFSNGDENKILEQITQYRESDYNENIVVYPGVGHRTYTFQDFRKIKLARWIVERIRRFVDRKKLYLEDYDIIHLRGGSKEWQGGRVLREELRDEINTKWPTREDYLDFLFEAYQQRTEKAAEPRRLLLMSDTMSLVTAWQERFGRGEWLGDTFNTHLEASGLHAISAETLSQLGEPITKEELNVQTLRDFVVMLNARAVIGDGISRFSVMAESIRSQGVRGVEFPRRPKEHP